MDWLGGEGLGSQNFRRSVQRFTRFLSQGFSEGSKRVVVLGFWLKGFGPLGPFAVGFGIRELGVSSCIVAHESLH